MFDKNWNIIIVTLIIVLIIFYFRNCYEGFGGNVKNDEAIQAVASIYNKDDMTVTNLTIPNELRFPEDGNKTKMTIKSTPGNKIVIERPGVKPFYINDGINMGAWDSWAINNDGAAKFSSINNTGRITTNELAVNGIVHSPLRSTGEVTAGGRLYATGQICIEDVCINKEHLRQLRDQNFNGLTVRGILNMQENGPGLDAYIDFKNHNGTRKQWFGYSYGGANRTL